MDQFKLFGSATNVNAFANWNGHEYDFYFTKAYKARSEGSFLFKVERTLAKPTLRLISPEFKFEAWGDFDAQAQYYVHRSSTNGGVYLRNVSDNSVRTLLGEGDESDPYPSFPRFYNEEIIYSRGDSLWRMGLDGGNNAPLFANTNLSVGSSAATKAPP